MSTFKIYPANNLALENSVNGLEKMLLKRSLTDHLTCIGPSGVRALPLGVAAGRSVHYFCDYFSFLFLSSVPHTFLPEGVVLGL